MSDFNTNSTFPMIDQMSESSRGIYIKDHEFQVAISEMIAEIDRLLSTDTNSSAIANAKSNVANALIEQSDTINIIESAIRGNSETAYLSRIKDQLVEVQAAYERLYAKIYSDIQSINANIENRTTVYDTVAAYRDRLIYKMSQLFGKASPYLDGRSETVKGLLNKYALTAAGTQSELRDTDPVMGYVTFPVIINPRQENADGEDVTQQTPIKLFEFTPIENGTDIPSFLLDVVISGDLFFYKGYVSSTYKSKTGKRGIDFISEITLNNELPFSFKVYYDSDNNKIAVAFKFEETSNGFTSTVKFDCSVNMLVGKDLVFSDPDDKMDIDNIEQA